MNGKIRSNERCCVTFITIESMAVIKISVITVTDLPVRSHFAKNTRWA